MRYSVTTKLDAEAAIERAVAYFGEEGLGLETQQAGACCATFSGGGGFVDVIVTAQEDETELELVTREWDRQVRAFMAEVG